MLKPIRSNYGDFGLITIFLDETNINGVQHYTFTGSKNSADLSLSLDALADLLKGRTKHIAVMSDDSDYASLFAAVKRENGVAENNRLPFMWLMTDRPDTRSQILTDFFPSEYIHIVSCGSSSEIPVEDNQKASSIKGTFSDYELIARAIIQNIPIGTFKSSDCKKILVKYFPTNNLGKADSALFGTQFLKVIWPFLEKLGVKSQQSARGARKYEMTEQAKKALG